MSVSCVCVRMSALVIGGWKGRETRQEGQEDSVCG